MMNTLTLNKLKTFTLNERASISYGMSEMARFHKDNLISNNLARVSEKVTAIGAAWGGSPLDKTDLAVVNYYLNNKDK